MTLKMLKVEDEQKHMPYDNAFIRFYPTGAGEVGQATVEEPFIKCDVDAFDRVYQIMLSNAEKGTSSDFVDKFMKEERNRFRLELNREWSDHLPISYTLNFAVK